MCTCLMKAARVAAILLRAGLRLQRQMEHYYSLIWWVLNSPARRLFDLYDLSITENGSVQSQVGQSLEQTDLVENIPDHAGGIGLNELWGPFQYK